MQERASTSWVWMDKLPFHVAAMRICPAKSLAAMPTPIVPSSITNASTLILIRWVGGGLYLSSLVEPAGGGFNSFSLLVLALMNSSCFFLAISATFMGGFFTFKTELISSVPQCQDAAAKQALNLGIRGFHQSFDPLVAFNSGFEVDRIPSRIWNQKLRANSQLLNRLVLVGSEPMRALQVQLIDRGCALAFERRLQFGSPGDGGD
ncbi:hypothetical protein PIB30_108351 [Stylosanthes scabra]|uniref:Uncharacterized protein n=1 Tax=Stylosanthes scabra TaxID=79078 RepID=A0ABU6V1Y1_9FABA|nr:hypothetical protein [Stylosanthes scabra]